MTPLRTHTHFSQTEQGKLQVSASRAKDLVKRAVRCGYRSIGFTDLGSVSGMVEAFAAAKDACKNCGNPKGTHDPAGKLLVKGESCGGYGKNDLVPIAGIELYVSRGDATDKSKLNDPLSRLTLLAPDRDGWDRLVRVTSESNRPDRYTSRPRLDLDATTELSGGKLVVVDGYPGSVLADALWVDPRLAYQAATPDQARGLLHDDWLGRGVESVGSLRERFNQVWVGVSPNDGWAASRVLADCCRKIAERAGVRCVAAPDVYYAEPHDAADQRVMLAGKLRCGLERAVTASEKSDPVDAVGLRSFFRTNRFHVPSAEDLTAFTPEELLAADDLAGECQTYGLENPPRLPDFPCPDGKSPDAHLTELCREGWAKLLGGRKFSDAKRTEYGDRFKYEIGVIEGAGLAPYFLIVRDFIQWAVSEKMLVGVARGSSGGSLVAYLSGITKVDPVRWGLLFERFYNSGRNSPGKVSLPDIDTDFPKSGRERVVDYMRGRYGPDRVAQIATFGPLKARAALKEVLKARGQMGEAEINELTKLLPEGEAAISDELQEMAEEEGDYSVIRWSLEHDAAKFAEFARLEGDHFEGPLAHEFAQAVRLEGVNRTMGKHPAGVVVSNRPVGEVCPIVYDKKTRTPISGFNMVASEKVGLVKFDVLALSTLDRVQTVSQLLRTRRSGEAFAPEEDEDESD